MGDYGAESHSGALKTSQTFAKANLKTIGLGTKVP